MADKWLLQDGSGSWLVQDSSGYWILQAQAGVGVPPSAFLAPKVTRRKTTNRILRRAGSNPATPLAASVGRALEQPFQTRIIESRRQLSQGWIAALAAYPQVQAQPISAWLAPVVIRRRETKRRQLPADFTAIERYTPPSIAWEAPKVIRVDFTRRLQKAAPQILFPPATGPPAAYYPAWATTQRPQAFQDRQRLEVEHVVYPETPKPEPNLCARIPGGLHKRRETRRRLLSVELGSYPTTPAVGAQPEAAWRARIAIRSEQTRKLLPQAPQITYPATPTPPPDPAWRAQVANRIERRRTLLQAAPQITYPRTIVADAAAVLVKALRRRDTERRLRKAAHAPLYQPTPVPPQPITAFIPGPVFRRHGWRQLRGVLELDDPQASDVKGYLVGVVQILPALDAVVTVPVALDAGVRIDSALVGSPRLRPE